MYGSSWYQPHNILPGSVMVAIFCERLEVNLNCTPENVRAKQMSGWSVPDTCTFLSIRSESLVICKKISLCKWNLRNLQPNTLDCLKMIQWLILSVSPFEVAQLWTPDVVEGASSTWLIVRNMAQRNDPRSCIPPSRTRRWWENSSSDSLYRLGKGTVTVHLSSYLFLFYWHCLFNETHLAQSCPVIQFSATYHVVLILSS